MQKPQTHEVDFLSPVSLCHGIGPKRVAALHESGIETIGDLLYYFPRRYIDRSTIVPLGAISGHVDRTCTVAGTVERAIVERGRRGRLRALLSDGSGSIELLWFAGVHVFRNLVRPGERFLVTGKVGHFKRFQMVHPIIERLHDDGDRAGAAFLPVYPLTEAMRSVGMNHRALARAVLWALDHCSHFPRVLPPYLEEKKAFPPLPVCLRQRHCPDSAETLERCSARLRYEELYKLALTLRWNRRAFNRPGRTLHSGDFVARFKATLPFALTDAQERAIAVLHADAAAPFRMHRLLQGDVGCGKTLVAFIACLPALASGLQVAWLAPTEVLALQTHRVVNAWLKPFGMRAALCRGAMSSHDKGIVRRGLADGTIRFVVGTHALLQPDIAFKHLGMVVIDEQHRFGVEQRRVLLEKDGASDFLLMSATPIPQTLAATLYGDLDIVTIDRLPPGRQPVATRLVPEHKRQDMEHFVRTLIEHESASAYWVAPRIASDDDGDDLEDVVSLHDRLSQGCMRGIPMACLHGRMSADEKDRVIQSFVSGDTRLLVATTVIEVGVDVPHASCMVIENAERFGMAQLHQLRGRVGRGAQKAWCFLLSCAETDPIVAQRLSYFCSHADGFSIADKDLELRGPGEVCGTRQAGWDDLKMVEIVRDVSLFKEIQEEIQHLPLGT